MWCAISWYLSLQSVLQQNDKEPRKINKFSDLNKLDELNYNKNPRNRIQAVHNIVNKNDVINDFDANYNVDQNEDKAKENNDDDVQNEDHNANQDETKKDGKKKILPRGKDSNEAVETFQESYEQGDDDGLDENDDAEEEEIILPPKDGSLKVIFSTHIVWLIPIYNYIVTKKQHILSISLII